MDIFQILIFSFKFLGCAIAIFVVTNAAYSY
jgi:hypothetical protein